MQRTLLFDRDLVRQFYRRGIQEALQEPQFRSVFVELPELDYVIEVVTTSHFFGTQHLPWTFWQTCDPKEIQKRWQRIKRGANPALQAVRLGEQALVLSGLIAPGELYGRRAFKDSEARSLTELGSELYAIGSEAWPNSQRNMRHTLRQMSHNFRTWVWVLEAFRQQENLDVMLARPHPLAP